MSPTLIVHASITGLVTDEAMLNGMQPLHGSSTSDAAAWLDRLLNYGEVRDHEKQHFLLRDTLHLSLAT